MNDIDAEIHGGIPRVGPGEFESTQRAFSMLAELPANPSILDVGSGPGMQTLHLARICEGVVTALDNNHNFLVELKRRAQVADLSERINIVQASMFEMPFNEECFDLIWSEGVIYIIGFEEGMRAWRRFLRNRGCMAVTHVSWLKKSIPGEAQEFWAKAYPNGLRPIDENCKLASNAGYHVLGRFTLPKSAWWNDYYTPLEEKLSRLRERYKSDPTALLRIDQTQRKIDLYRKYSDWYGYVFYVMQKEG